MNDQWKNKQKRVSKTDHQWTGNTLFLRLHARGPSSHQVEDCTCHLLRWHTATCPRLPPCGCRSQLASYHEWLEWPCRHCSCNCAMFATEETAWCDVDLDPMTLRCKPYLHPLKMYLQCRPTINFLGRGFQEFEHYKQTNRQTDRQTDTTKRISPQLPSKQNQRQLITCLSTSCASSSSCRL